MPPVGRPRDPQLDDAAMEATLDLLVEEGYHSLSMDRVAIRAGVSKAALYRRWPNKLELAADALAHFSGAGLALPDTGEVGPDLVAYVLGLIPGHRTGAKAYQALSGVLDDRHELGVRCRKTLHAGMAAGFHAIVTRAVARGQLPPDTDIELLADVVPALARHHRQETGWYPDEAWVRRVAAQFFEPARPGGRAED